MKNFYNKKFNDAIVSNIDYWANYPPPFPNIEDPNLFKSIEIALKIVDNSSIVENLIKNHFYWIENVGNPSKWIYTLGEYYNNYKNHPSVSIWVIHFWSILLWKGNHHKKSIEVNVELNSRSIIGDPLLKASINYHISRGYWTINQPGLAEKYARFALLSIEMVNERNYLFGMIKNLLGMIFSKHGESSRAISLFEAAEKYYLDENITQLMGEGYHNISKEYQKNGNIKLALIYFGKAAQHKYDQQAWSGLSEIEFSRAILYYKLGRLKNALDAFKRGIDLSSEIQPLSLNQGWISLARGYMYLLQGDVKSAKIDFDKSNEIWKTIGRDDLIEFAREAINLTNR